MKFCRNCGTVLTGVAPGAPPGPPPGAAPFSTPAGGYGGPVAAPYGAPAPATAPPTYPGSGLVVCPRCNSQTPAGFAFCQQCGVQLPAVDPSGPTMAGGGPESIRAGSIGRPGAGLAQPMPQPMPPPGPPPAAPPQGSRPGAPGPAAAAAAAPAWGTAISVNRDGSDGDRFPLGGEFVVIGRAGADVAFDQDRFLARSHARIERAGDTVRVVPIDTLNGVFKKLDAPIELVDGAIALVGREVLRFELLDADERAAEPLVRHGVALFGSPPREPWGRFIQLLPSGGARDIRHLWGDEVVLGREEGDLVFRDDAFMSRRHAAVTWDGRRATLTDLGSSNGTFLRLTGPIAIRNNDQLRMGDQLFRFELRR